jgi:hypothetical protein
MVRCTVADGAMRPMERIDAPGRLNGAALEWRRQIRAASHDGRALRRPDREARTVLGRARAARGAPWPEPRAAVAVAGGQPHNRRLCPRGSSRSASGCPRADAPRVCPGKRAGPDDVGAGAGGAEEGPTAVPDELPATLVPGPFEGPELAARSPGVRIDRPARTINPSAATMTIRLARTRRRSVRRTRWTLAGRTFKA